MLLLVATFHLYLRLSANSYSLSLYKPTPVEIHHFGFWDAQIWATARLNQIEEVYSEDFASGATVEGVRFTNHECRKLVVKGLPRSDRVVALKCTP
jgi:hypothetical protein